MASSDLGLPASKTMLVNLSLGYNKGQCYTTGKYKKKLPFLYSSVILSYEMVQLI